MHEARKKVGSPSSNHRLPERTRDAAIKELENLVDENGEYPYVHKQSIHCIEVHSICKHGICRAGLVASAENIEDPEGPWNNDESWEGEPCPICDEERCPDCGKIHILCCPQCHRKVTIELPEDEAIRLYMEGKNLFEELKCDTCGSRIMVLSRDLDTMMNVAPCVGNRQSIMSPQPGRNDPCPCGSGRKYRRCCKKKGENRAYAVSKMQ